MEKLILRFINIFINCFFSLLIFCKLFELEFSLGYVFALSVIMYVLCYRN